MTRDFIQDALEAAKKEGYPLFILSLDGAQFSTEFVNFDNFRRIDNKTGEPLAPAGSIDDFCAMVREHLEQIAKEQNGEK